LPKLPPGIPKPYPPPPVIVTAISCPPAISYFTLPQLHIWKDWVEGRPGYRFGANRVPSGTFDDPSAIEEGGWVDVSYQNDQIVHEIKNPHREPAPKSAPEKPNQPKSKPEERFEDEVIADGDNVIQLKVSWKNLADLDIFGLPFLDFPMAAIR